MRTSTTEDAGGGGVVAGATVGAVVWAVVAGTVATVPAVGVLTLAGLASGPAAPQPTRKLLMTSAARLLLVLISPAYAASGCLDLRRRLLAMDSRPVACSPAT